MTMGLLVMVLFESSIRLAVLPDQIHQWMNAFILPVTMLLWIQPASSMADSMVWSSGVMLPSDISVIQLSWLVRWLHPAVAILFGPPP